MITQNCHMKSKKGCTWQLQNIYKPLSRQKTVSVTAIKRMSHQFTKKHFDCLILLHMWLQRVFLLFFCQVLIWTVLCELNHLQQIVDEFFLLANQHGGLEQQMHTNGKARTLPAQLSNLMQIIVQAHAVKWRNNEDVIWVGALERKWVAQWKLSNKSSSWFNQKQQTK